MAFTSASILFLSRLLLQPCHTSFGSLWLSLGVIVSVGFQSWQPNRTEWRVPAQAYLV